MKIIKTLLLTIILLLLSACGNKVAFKKQEPLENAALVYIYSPIKVLADESSSDPEYSIRINNKPYMQRIKEGEYIVLNLKPHKMTISATRNQIQEKILNMNLKKGQIYYLRIEALEDTTFDFKQVNNFTGLNEIAKTGLSGSSEESPENIITEFVNPKEEESMQVKAAVVPVAAPTRAPQTIAPMQQAVPMQTVPRAPISKTDEIMKAYEMKEKGIVNDEEFKALKANILNK
jgi:hypothetical protein